MSSHCISIIGYGNQGRSQALNLRDSGESVIIGSINDRWKKVAIADGFKVYSIEESLAKADLHFILIPDDILAKTYSEVIENKLKKCDTLIFASGYNIKYKRIKLPETINVLLIAPRMIGVGVREFYLKKKPFYCFSGIHQNYLNADTILKKLITSIGSDESNSIEVSMDVETELDLFTEQCLVPAIKHALLTSIKILVDNGYNEKAVLLELYKSGELGHVFMKAAEIGIIEQSKYHSRISQYGSMSRLEKFEKFDLYSTMGDILNDIKNGDFNKEIEKMDLDELFDNEKISKLSNRHFVTQLEKKHFG